MHSFLKDSRNMKNSGWDRFRGMAPPSDVSKLRQDGAGRQSCESCSFSSFLGARVGKDFCVIFSELMAVDEEMRQTLYMQFLPFF